MRSRAHPFAPVAAATLLAGTAGASNAAITPSGGVWEYDRPADTWTSLPFSPSDRNINPRELWVSRQANDTGSLNVTLGSTLVAGDINVGTKAGSTLQLTGGGGEHSRDNSTLRATGDVRIGGSSLWETDAYMHESHLIGDSVTVGAGATLTIDLGHWDYSRSGHQYPYPEDAKISSESTLYLAQAERIIVTTQLPSFLMSGGAPWAPFFTIFAWEENFHIDWINRIEFDLPSGWRYGFRPPGTIPTSNDKGLIFVRAPEPGALALLAISGLSLSSRRRR
jgi:hypothetical protein